MQYLIREMKAEEYPQLSRFLYEAIFLRKGETPPPMEIINKPELKVYYEDFGRPDDRCLCAEADSRLIGAVWVRNIAGYGSVDEHTPEFAISVLKEYRGSGIGTELMKQMLAVLKKQGYSKASLAVQKDNYALKMYRRLGFQITDENEQEYIMIYHF